MSVKSLGVALAAGLMAAIGACSSGGGAGGTPTSGAAAPGTPWVKDDAFTAARAEWFRQAKFGMFIHWGLYAVPAGVYHGHEVPGIGEWIMNDAKIKIPEYETFAKQFDPEKFDAHAWVKVAADAGMKYICITSKHHDGFCMWPTKVMKYNIADATPFKRDPLAELAAACREQGLTFCVYHSIMDWHHPELQGSPTANADAATSPDDPRVIAYIEKQLKPQLKELIENYDPAMIWFDGNWVKWWNGAHAQDLEAYLHTLKPGILINNRISGGGVAAGDYETPEQTIPAAALGKKLWETCMTLNDTWGYKTSDHHWKSADDVVRKLADIAGKGGNFLLNVGPTAQGEIPPESVAILEKAGEWVRPHGEAIYGTTYSSEVMPKWGSITRKGNRWNAIVFKWPTGSPADGIGGVLALPTSTPVTAAKVMDGQMVEASAPTTQGVLLHGLPEQKPTEPATVVQVDFASAPVAIEPAMKVAHAKNGVVTLMAEDARLHGGMRLEEDHENLGYWTRKDDWAEWTAALPAGTYEVELLTCVANGNGGAYTLSIGNEKLHGRARPTSAGWHDYKPVSLGKVTVEGGNVVVSIKPEEVHNALMNVQSVKLTMVK